MVQFRPMKNSRTILVIHFAHLRVPPAKNEVYVLAANPNDHVVTNPKSPTWRNSKVCYQVAEHVRLISTDLISISKKRNPENFTSELNQLINDGQINAERQPKGPANFLENVVAHSGELFGSKKFVQRSFGNFQQS